MTEITTSQEYADNLGTVLQLQLTTLAAQIALAVKAGDYTKEQGAQHLRDIIELANTNTFPSPSLAVKYFDALEVIAKALEGGGGLGRPTLSLVPN